MYAVLETGGKQYRVAAGDKLEVEKLPVEAGQSYSFDKILMVSNDGEVTLGTPTVEGASVEASVVEHKRGKKLTVFKMRRRKGFRKKKGHRQDISVVEIKDIKA
ncbi:MAG: 50S ribosomal protein L21 [Verrucomicrobiales bacterium]|nr:50S ribosomal protein L21 [Verrucomicrobiales bacterium]|tara:strand:- start:304 stop:615 length:312 start_codon:yes stop_codon:yes gene_type:complete